MHSGGDWGGKIKKDIVIHLSRDRWDVYWCLKTRLVSTAQDGLWGIVNHVEVFMHHITFAELVSLCMHVSVFTSEGCWTKNRDQFDAVSAAGHGLSGSTTICQIRIGLPRWHNADQSCHQCIRIIGLQWVPQTVPQFLTHFIKLRIRGSASLFNGILHSLT